MSQRAPSDPGSGNGSNGPPAPAATVERDAVRLRREVDADTHEVPVVQYSIESDREAAAVVRVVDSLPDGVEPSDVGFHDEYHGDGWSVPDEGTVAFERAVDAGETVTTLFGVRREPDAFEAAESAPDLEVEPDVDESDRADGAASDNRAADDAVGELPATIELDDPTAGFVGDDPEGADAGDRADDGNEADGPAAERSGDRGADRIGESATALEDAAVDADTVAGALVTELRGDRLDEGDREALRQALGRQLSESTTAFVEHVQTRLESKRERIEAEVETLEDSVRELYGLKADAGEVDRLAEELSRVDETAVRTEQFRQLERLVTHLSEAKADLERIEAAEDAAAELRDEKADAERVADLEDDLDALEERKADAERVADLEAEIERLDEESATAERADRLEAAIDDLREATADADALADLREAVDRKADREAVDDRIEELRSSKADAEDVDERIEELRDGKADVWTIDQIRNRIDEVEAETPDDEDVERLAERVDLAHEEKASRATVEELRRRLDEEFVTEAEVSGTVERRFDRSLHATASLSVAVAAVALAFLLAVRNPAEPVSAVVTFLVGVVAAAFWKFQQPAAAAESAA